ncbi:MAG: SBBP repeat-containing protein, partial [Saprospiraceae bacterium]
ETCCDYVSIYDGVDANGTLIGQYNGTTIPPDALATSGSMYITFTSDGSVTRDGFEASYSVGAIIATVTQQQDVSCFGGNDGSVEITVLGNPTLPFTVDGIIYNTNPFTITGLLAGTSTLNIIDNAGNTTTKSITIEDGFVPTITFNNTAACSGNDGVLELVSTSNYSISTFRTGFQSVQKLLSDGTNIYASKTNTGEVFKISPSGAIDTLITGTGDGTNALSESYYLAKDLNNNIFVTGEDSDNAFKIDVAGNITQIINNTGDATNNLFNPHGIATDNLGNVYVTGYSSDNVFKITPSGVITEIINASGNGSNILDGAEDVVVDNLGNVYVSGLGSNNVFKITLSGVITEIINSSGDGSNSLSNPTRLVLDSQNNLYVIGEDSDNIFKITSGGVITEIINSSGDGTNSFNNPIAIEVDNLDNIYSVGYDSGNVFQITPNGTITEIMDNTTDGSGGYGDPSFRGLTIDNNNNVYTSDFSSGKIFEIAPLELSYSIDGMNFQNNNEFNGLGANSYTVTIMDNFGCTNIFPTTLDGIIATTSVSCNGANGEITVTASGGTGTLEYSSDNGVMYQPSNIFTGLAIGSYDIVVKDANGCTTA